jgi:hypothetical protein
MGPTAANRWFSSGADDHPIVHEIAHALHNLTVGAANYTRVRNHQFRPEQAALVRREVSGYAATKPVEFVAETFAGLKAGKTYSPAIMQLYVKLGGPDPAKLASGMSRPTPLAMNTPPTGGPNP